MARHIGTKNLKPVRTKREAKERGRKGGIASGEARRAKRTFKDRIKWLMELPMGEGSVTEDTDIKNVRLIPSANLTAIDQIIVAQFQKAAKGDTKAAEFIRDTLGEKPKEKMEIKSDIKNESIEKVEALVNKELKGRK